MKTGFEVCQNEQGGYFIYINGARKPCRAQTSTEVRTALEHWGGGGTFYGQSHYLLNNPRCPICRSMEGK